MYVAYCLHLPLSCVGYLPLVQAGLRHGNKSITEISAVAEHVWENGHDIKDIGAKG